MKRLWAFLGYGFFTLLITALFLYILFPEASIRRMVELKLPHIKPDFSVSIGKLNPTLPLGLTFMDSTFKYSGIPVLFVKKIRLSLNPFSLFRTKTTYYFDASAYEGKIDGYLDAQPGSAGKNITFAAALKEISLEKMLSLMPVSGKKISGTLTGQLLYQADDKKMETVSATLTASDIKAELDSQWVVLNRLNFKSLEADLKIQDQILMIRQSLFKGAQLDGRISGSIFLNRKIDSSVLNLSGKIKLHPLLIAGLGKETSTLLFAMNKNEPNLISFKIGGTFKKPAFSLEPL